MLDAIFGIFAFLLIFFVIVLRRLLRQAGAERDEPVGHDLPTAESDYEDRDDADFPEEPGWRDVVGERTPAPRVAAPVPDATPVRRAVVTRVPAAPADESAPARRSGSRRRRRLRADLGSARNLRHAFLLKELLEPPVALRHERTG